MASRNERDRQYDTQRQSREDERALYSRQTWQGGGEYGIGQFQQAQFDERDDRDVGRRHDQSYGQRDEGRFGPYGQQQQRGQWRDDERYGQRQLGGQRGEQRYALREDVRGYVRDDHRLGERGSVIRDRDDVRRGEWRERGESGRGWFGRDRDDRDERGKRSWVDRILGRDHDDEDQDEADNRRRGWLGRSRDEDESRRGWLGRGRDEDESRRGWFGRSRDEDESRRGWFGRDRDDDRYDESRRGWFGRDRDDDRYDESRRGWLGRDRDEGRYDESRRGWLGRDRDEDRYDESRRGWLGRNEGRVGMGRGYAEEGEQYRYREPSRGVMRDVGRMYSRDEDEPITRGGRDWNIGQRRELEPHGRSEGRYIDDRDDYELRMREDRDQSHRYSPTHGQSVRSGRDDTHRGRT